jgi:O-antigen/teichoic acid export membrane protein
MSSIPIETIAQAVEEPPRPRQGLRAVVQSIGSKVAILALQAATGIVTARTLGPAGRGELAAMILWPLFVASVTTLGVPSSLIYQLRRWPEERDRLIANGFFLATVMGTLAAVACALVLPWWLRQYSPQVVDAAKWFLITVPICAVTLAGRAVLEGSHDFSASNAIQTLTPLATLLGLLVFLVMHRINPYTAAIAYVAASVPAFWLMIDRVRRAGMKSFRVHGIAIKRIMSYGIRSYGIDVLGTLALQVDQVLVVSLLTPSAMGSYVVVLSLSRMLNLFQNSVVMVLFPKAAGLSKEDVVGMTGDAARISGLAAAVCGVVVCAAGPTLLRALYGQEFVAAVGALRILVVEVILSGATFVLAQAFMALDRPGVVTLLQSVGLSLSIPMMLWLIPRYGIYGAAASLLTSTAARLLFVCVGFKVFLKTNPPDLLPKIRDVRVLLGALSAWRLERAA